MLHSQHTHEVLASSLSLQTSLVAWGLYKALPTQQVRG